jgi:hypothetical protein
MSLLTTIPGPFALTWWAGNTVPLTFYYNRLDGTIPNMVGGEIWVTFKDSLNDADPGILQKTYTGGKVIITDSVNGVATAYMTPAESTITGLEHRYYVSLKVKESNGNEWPLANGTLTLIQTATRSV